MRPWVARGFAAGLLVAACGVTVWLWVRTSGASPYPGFAAQQLLVGIWPFLALPLALLGRAHLALALVVPYVALALLFGFGIGGPHLTVGIPAFLLALAALYRDETIERRPVAASVVLVAVALVVAGAFAALTLQCGIMRTEAVAPGEPPAPSTCVSRLHPMSVVLAVGALGSLVALVLGRPEVPLVAGLVFALLGVPLVFSAGAWTWLVGFALLGAGAVRLPVARRAPAA